ncbi:MAG: glycosyltransferase family 2 protein, partial [Planctomycetota bacterium]|nr:glycosyltransferase family 2 protein [Planctomycetota bacterium]
MVEVSIVMPCLNEAETLESCVSKALRFLASTCISGEVIVADNGSTDGSQDIARRAGARVVDARTKGYGAALMEGFAAARGKFLIMGDADDSYDFLDLMPFIRRLREGYDIVVGNRFRGGIKPGAMPWLHRYIGNPVLTGILNVLYRSGIDDAHCGLRGLTKQAYESLSLRTTGMEFASEMIVKAAARGLRMCEVPTVLSPDGRSRPPHLRSFQDGWRHLRFLVLLSPKWCLMIPGAILMALGVLLGATVFTSPLQIQGVVLDVHTLVASSLMAIVGYQSITIGIAARIYAVQEEIGPPSALLQDSFKIFTLERG